MLANHYLGTKAWKCGRFQRLHFILTLQRIYSARVLYSRILTRSVIPSENTLNSLLYSACPLSKTTFASSFQNFVHMEEPLASIYLGNIDNVCHAPKSSLRLKLSMTKISWEICWDENESLKCNPTFSLTGKTCYWEGTVKTFWYNMFYAGDMNLEELSEPLSASGHWPSIR
jgi:hypothetical protein